MTDRAYVTQDFPRGVAVHLVQERGQDRYAVGLPTDIVFRDQDADAAGTYQEPTLRLPESIARALLDALAAHFGGTAEVQTLRGDYLAERARVDKMIDHLTSRPALATGGIVRARPGSLLVGE